MLFALAIYKTNFFLLALNEARVASHNFMHVSILAGTLPTRACRTRQVDEISKNMIKKLKRLIC